MDSKPAATGKRKAQASAGGPYLVHLDAMTALAFETMAATYGTDVASLIAGAARIEAQCNATPEEFEAGKMDDEIVLTILKEAAFVRKTLALLALAAGAKGGVR